MSSSPTVADGRRRSSSVIALCFAALVLEGYDLLMFGTVVPSLLRHPEWGLDAAAVGLLGSAMAVGMVVGAVVAAMLTDRIGRRLVVVASVATFSVGMAASAAAPTPELLGVFRFLVGVGAGALMPTAAAVLVEFSPEGRRTRTSAWGFVGACVGGILAGGLSLVVVPAFGFRGMFAAGAVPALLVLPALLRWMPESPAFLMSVGRVEEAAAIAARFGVSESVAPARDRRRGVRGLFGRGRTLRTLLFWGAMFFCQMGLFLVSSWLPQVVTAAGYGGSPALALLVVLNAGTIVGILLAAPLADRWGQRRVTVAAFVLAAAALVSTSLFPPLSVVYLLAAVMGFGTLGAQVLLNAFIATCHPAESRTAGVGAALAVGRLGAIVGPTYGGLLVAGGLDVRGQLLCFAVPAVLAALAVLAVRDARRRAD